MSKEISNLSIKGTFVATGETTGESFGDSSLTEDVVEKVYVKARRSIGTSEELIPLGEIVAPKRVYVRNRGAFPIRLHATTGQAATSPLEVGAGSHAYFNWNGATVYMIAIGGASDASYFIAGT
jgi:hypothetical protein